MMHETNHTEHEERRADTFSAEALLPRDPIQIDNAAVAAYYRGKTVLITGGGGSIGSEICRQIARLHPAHLVLVDIYENGAYELQQEMFRLYGNVLSLSVEILSVCDTVLMDKTIAKHRPDVIVHAAAHKHVPLMEHNPCEAIKNNVLGTQNVISFAVKHGVGRFLLISSDKAVNPTGIMGATKRMCEMLVQGYRAKHSHTQFAVVRFGNVLGSAGSVIPLFRRQIAEGGPLTLTDKRITRYFMTISEAAQLVLEASVMARGDELFVLDMGKPVQILTLAENMIRHCGYEPYTDIDIIETGLRPGEKLYEELLVQPEKMEKTANALIFVERETPITYEEMIDKLAHLTAAANSGDDSAARAALMQTVPTFRTAADTSSTAQNTAWSVT